MIKCKECGKEYYEDLTDVCPTCYLPKNKVRNSGCLDCENWATNLEIRGYSWTIGYPEYCNLVDKCSYNSETGKYPIHQQMAKKNRNCLCPQFKRGTRYKEVQAIRRKRFKILILTILALIFMGIRSLL